MSDYMKFAGSFSIDPPLKPEHQEYLYRFSETRRMRRDPEICKHMPDLVREAVGLPLGLDACYFVGGDGFYGQHFDDSIVDYNAVPCGQPGLWCRWTPTEAGTIAVRPGCEKFSSYTAWLRYLIQHFLEPWGYTANGAVSYYDKDDDSFCGVLYCDDNTVENVKDTGRAAAPAGEMNGISD